MKIANKILLTFLVLLSPFFVFGTLFGLAGATAKYSALIGLGYIVAIVFSIVGLSRSKYIFGVFIGLALIVIGMTLDSQFWSEQNSNLCKDLRSDPSCVESESGFSCKNFKGSGARFVTGIGVCSQ